ncbi:hypothetical protein [Devosia sp. A369]
MPMASRDRFYQLMIALEVFGESSFAEAAGQTQRPRRHRAPMPPRCGSGSFHVITAEQNSASAAA